MRLENLANRIRQTVSGHFPREIRQTPSAAFAELFAVTICDRKRGDAEVTVCDFKFTQGQPPMTDKNKGELTVAPETLYEVIHRLRGQQVMLDEDLAELYGVETKALNQAVKRNETRFPDDFMFQVSNEEWETLRSQSVTAKAGRGGRRTPPYAFTQEGVAMLSSVLTSDRAIQVNIEIMRVFVRFRRYLANQEELAIKLKELESRFEGKLAKQDQHTRMLFEAVRRLSDEVRKTPPPPAKGKRRIGFHTEEDESDPKATAKPKAKKRGQS